MVQRKAETPCLITAYEQHIVPIMETHGFKIIDDLTIMSIDFLRILGLFFFICVTAKRKTFLVNIHSDVNCAIIHLMTSNLYAVIPVPVVTFLPTLYR